MLIRCPDCNQLFPKHHGQHRNCKGSGAAKSQTGSLSLKERLERGSPAGASSSRTSNSAASAAADSIRSRIQSKFNKSSEPESVPTPQSTSDSVEELDLEVSEVPTSKGQDDEEEMDTWTPENGGLCPSCDAYNPGHNAFCGNCEAMLLKSVAADLQIETSYDLKEIRGLVHTFVAKLEKFKIKTTEDVLRVCVRRKNRAMLAKHTGMAERSLLRLAHTANLCRIPSINAEQVAMLEMIAINSLEDLLKYKASDLNRKLEQNRMQINRQGIMFFPTKSKISLWLQEAKELEPIKIDP